MYSFRKFLLLVKTLTFRKIWNFALIYLSFHYSLFRKKAIHWGNPIKVGIEPTTYCNLRCPECPSGLRAFTRPTGMLQPENFRKMVDQLKDDLIYLLMYFQGEPFLNRKFLEMAKYATEKGIYVATSTNGHYITETIARQTVESGLTEVIVSIDGTTQETYESYRVGGELSKVIQGVKNLVEARKSMNSITPYILVQFLVVKPNEHQIEDIKKQATEWGADGVLLKTAQIYEYEDGSDLIPDNPRYSRYKKSKNGKWELKNPLKNQCWKLWHGAEITWDGKVLPCCFDKDAQYEMGNLLTQSFKSIWRGSHYERFRSRLLSSRKEIDICRNCSEGLSVFSD